MTKFRKWRLLSGVLIYSISILILPQSFATTHKPTIAQIEAAKRIEEEKKKSAAISAKKLAAAAGSLKKLAALAAEVNRKYLSAKNELLIAVRELNSATQAVEAAEAEVFQTHTDIGKLAVAAYVSGSDMGGIENLLSANGPQDVIDTLA